MLTTTSDADIARSLVGGERVDAQSGATFEAMNDADGAVPGTLPACLAAVDAAVASGFAGCNTGVHAHAQHTIRISLDD